MLVFSIDRLLRHSPPNGSTKNGSMESHPTDFQRKHRTQAEKRTPYACENSSTWFHIQRDPGGYHKQYDDLRFRQFVVSDEKSALPKCFLHGLVVKKALGQFSLSVDPIRFLRTASNFTLLLGAKCDARRMPCANKIRCGKCRDSS